MDDLRETAHRNACIEGHDHLLQEITRVRAHHVGTQQTPTNIGDDFDMAFRPTVVNDRFKIPNKDN